MLRLMTVGMCVVLTSFSEIEKPFPMQQFTESGGREVSLFPSDRPFTYVQVWASWCKPCRKHNRELMRMMEDSLVRTQLRPVFISLDTDSITWRKAMRNDGIQTTESYRVEGGLSGSFAKKLGVRGLPANFLLNDQGHIISSDCAPGRLTHYINK